MKNRFLILLSFVLIVGRDVICANTSMVRERINMNRDWRYQIDDPDGTGTALHYSQLKPYLLPCANDFIIFGKRYQRPEGNPGENIAYVKSDFDDSEWRHLNLPHDWAIEGPFNIDYNGSTGKLPYWGIRWYRKTLELSQDDAGKQIYLDIDGAMSYASVWCNGQYVGGWPYGYASFRLDLTPYIKAGQKNVLAIRLDNPDDTSRWYPGSGIYRNVWLVKTSPVHVEQWGTFVRNQQVDSEIAVMEMGVNIENHAGKDVQVKLQTSVYLQGKDGRPVGEEVTQSMTKDIAIKKDSWSSARFQFKVDKPKLWDIDTPNCYVAVSRVFMDGKEMDSYETPFGIRTIEFTHDQGFMLNGQKLAIKGVCMHHDLGALGAAFNEVAAERQLRIMKEMGANAIRTSHNPPAPELVALCDRMGLMMQLELADTWQKGKRKNDYNLLFDDWSEADMRSLVRHYRNHPSVIMWSIGNEMPDQTTDQGIIIARNLTAYCHDEDPTRPTSLGCNKRDAVFRDIVNQVDIFGLNYFHKTYPVFKEQNPTRRYHASETSSATSSRGEYFFPVTTDVNDSRSGFQLSSYDMTTIGWGCAPEVQFKMNEEYPFMSGEFVWTGFDYLGEPTPYNKDLTNLLNFSDPNELEKARKELEELGKIKTPSRSSYFGIVDLCGFPKDRYYNYKSYWRPDVPTVHILPHWNWEERIGEITPVHIYTSGDAVELFLNGKSLGRREKAHSYDRLTWDDVRYEPGSLKAIAYKNGQKWAEELVETTGKPAALQVTAEKTELKNDGTDLSFIRVAVVDSQGRVVPRSKNHLKFSVTGPAEIIATDNGDATSLLPFQLSERDAYNGLALVILRSQYMKQGKVVLTVESKGLPKQKIALKVE
ncbi:glycoside hydrolase family 2 protein [Bacteroides intestinalis]|uniref:Glycoside hydrolase family 2 protein n=1 Tax=Bacteroides intestinalis TaxID=329854 RepID=A0A412Y8T3_9BACE|nr:beta-galactosidase GalB [Bacteroides intestinalis]RGV53887.1 glycoside hydrolase family 2 protein [Bacteroides intestinalis]RHA59863.1 glycoside hydrolase family 2 protein [Bacteroides intestinalis]